MKKVLAIAGSLLLVTSPVRAETWYLFVKTISSYSSTGDFQVNVLEMQSREGCETAGMQLDNDRQKNKLQWVKDISYSCLKKQ